MKNFRFLVFENLPFWGEFYMKNPYKIFPSSKIKIFCTTPWLAFIFFLFIINTITAFNLSTPGCIFVCWKVRCTGLSDIFWNCTFWFHGEDLKLITLSSSRSKISFHLASSSSHLLPILPRTFQTNALYEHFLLFFFYYKLCILNMVCKRW